MGRDFAGHILCCNPFPIPAMSYSRLKQTMADTQQTSVGKAIDVLRGTRDTSHAQHTTDPAWLKAAWLT
ncbi:unnamed protein product, partial [Ectocarpus sp. 12 AP-2014]